MDPCQSVIPIMATAVDILPPYYFSYLTAAGEKFILCLNWATDQKHKEPNDRILVSWDQPEMSVFAPLLLDIIRKLPAFHHWVEC